MQGRGKKLYHLTWQQPSHICYIGARAIANEITFSFLKIPSLCNVAFQSKLEFEKSNFMLLFFLPERRVQYCMSFVPQLGTSLSKCSFTGVTQTKAALSIKSTTTLFPPKFSSMASMRTSSIICRRPLCTHTVQWAWQLWYKCLTEAQTVASNHWRRNWKRYYIPVSQTAK